MSTARQWAREAIRIIEADFQRSADTHLIPLPLPGRVAACIRCWQRVALNWVTPA